MKKRIFPSIGIFYFWCSGLHFFASQMFTVKLIIILEFNLFLNLKVSQFMTSSPASIQPLILSEEIEQFLQKLESAPPNWTQLRHNDITQQSERLFQFNRQRDKARADKNAILEKPIAFLWAGILRDYLPEYQGFSLALGPEFIHTSWGIIRFKPINLPDYLVAIPSLEVRKQLSDSAGTREQSLKLWLYV